MNHSSKIADTIGLIKDLSEGLTGAEKEALRDELLAYLLFSGFSKEENNTNLSSRKTMKGISPEELELLHKLAAQTEALYKAMNKNPEETNGEN